MHRSSPLSRSPSGPRRGSGVLAAALLVLWTVAAAAAPLAKDSLVFLVPQGSGTASRFVVADSADASVNRLWERISNDPEVLRAAEIYMDIQADRIQAIRAELERDGWSAEDEALMADLPPPQPVYVEVRPGTGGAYNDWKARFRLVRPDGTEAAVFAPRIVFQANDPVAVGPDRELFAQTLVHEISHGFHAQLVGPGNTPTTPWLSRPHSGNSTSDGTLALIEGYAEFVAAYITGRETIAQDPAGALTQNLYAYGPDGQPKRAGDLWKTEGWAAAVLLDVAKKVPGGFDAINAAIGDENPETFQQLVDDLQRRHPEHRDALRAIVKDKSFGRIYPEAGPVEDTTDAGDGGFDTPWNDDAGDRKGWSVGRIVASVVGGALGATFGVPFGPAGMLLGAAVGAGAGALLGKLFDGDGGASSFDWGAFSPFTQGRPDPFQEGTPYYGYGAAAPSTRDPAEARHLLDEAYRRYLDAASSATSIHPKELEAARQAYEAAQSAYRTTLGNAR